MGDGSRAPAGVHDEVGLGAVERRGCGERFRGKPHAVLLHALQLCADGNAHDAEFRGAVLNHLVERGARDVVGKGGELAAADGLEIKRDGLVRSKREGHAGLSLPDGGDAFADAEPVEHGEDDGDERLADDQLRPRSVIKHHHRESALEEMARERRARRPAADDGYGLNTFLHANFARMLRGAAGAGNPRGTFLAA